MAKPSLADEIAAFAAVDKRRRGPVCLVCRLPKDLREGVEGARAQGVEMTAISRWLAKRDLRIGDNTLGHHFRNGHHEGR